MDGSAWSQANHNPYVLVDTDNDVLLFANVQESMISLWSIDDSANGRTGTWGQ
jgi:hypothetical protein